MLLVMRAEETLNALDETAPPPLTREFEALVVLTVQIPDEGLRQELKGLLNEAGRAWQAGDREEARRIIGEVVVWLDEHEGELEEPLVNRMRVRILRISRLTEQTP
jgi:hypothetical protein